MSGMRPVFKNALLAVAGVVAGVLLVELLFALFYPQRIRSILTQSVFFGEHDEELGWRTKPGSSSKHLFINDKGYRGKEFPYEKTGKKRVLAFGDSATFGYYLDEESTYPHYLQKTLGDGYEVLNMGVPSYGLDQSYLLYKREGPKYKPDSVVFGVTSNDIYDITCSMRFGFYKPFFRLVDGKLKLFNTPVPKKIPIEDVFFKGQPLKARLFKHSNVFRFLFYRFADINKALDVSLEEMSLEDGVKVAAAIIADLKQRCADEGSKLIFLIFPREDRLGGVPSDEGYGYYLRIMDILKNEGVPFIDLHGAFRKNSGRKLYLEGDPVHPNAAGNVLIVNEIVSSGLVE